MPFTSSASSVSPISPKPFPANRAGNRLANLGYTARWVENDEMVITPPLCAVPSGAFQMGSDPSRDEQAKSNEYPQHTVTLAAYQIMRYPVTVAEYACAVRVGATPEPQPGRFRPITWQEQLTRLNHPVVCVCWRDAVAYAAWLAETTGQPWRLPTEAEWEKAARGTDGRIYPWGDQWDEARCTTSESGIGGTTPVGIYAEGAAHGASASGAQEMAGNVWEWCSSLYRPYPYSGNDGREKMESAGRKILRGGSWHFGAQVARVAYRGFASSSAFSSYFGFRLVLSAGV